MKSENNTTKVGFSKAYDMLPAGIQASVRARIMQECEWVSSGTFYNKMNGVAPIKLPEWKVLQEIFGESGIDVFTGETLKTA
jgi:hypothetical protein